jgi:hypothetical protein
MYRKRYIDRLATESDVCAGRKRLPADGHVSRNEGVNRSARHPFVPSKGRVVCAAVPLV